MKKFNGQYFLDAGVGTLLGGIAGYYLYSKIKGPGNRIPVVAGIAILLGGVAGAMLQHELLPNKTKI